MKYIVSVLLTNEVVDEEAIELTFDTKDSAVMELQEVRRAMHTCTPWCPSKIPEELAKEDGLCELAINGRHIVGAALLEVEE